MTRDLSLAAVAADLGVKPLSARSVVAAALLRTDEQLVAPAFVVRVAEKFGISEGAARVAMSRMTATGEIANVDGRYRLAGRLLRYERRAGGARWPERGPWDRTWLMQVVTVEGRTHTDRQALRAAMRGLRFAPFAGGCWLRPDNIASGQPDDAAAIAAAQCACFVVTPPEDAAELIGRLWDLPAWNAHAGRLLATIAALRPSIAAGQADAFAPGLVVSAAGLVHVTNDPLLPDELLPPGWVGHELRDALDDHDALCQQVLREWAST